MRAFNRLAREAAHAASAEPILDALRHDLTEVLSPDRVRLLDDTDARPAGVLATGRPLAGPAPPDGAPAGVLAAGRPLADPDARAAGHDVAAVLYVPVAWAGEVRSVMMLGWKQPRAISGDDVAAADLAGPRAA